MAGICLANVGSYVYCAVDLRAVGIYTAPSPLVPFGFRWNEEGTTLKIARRRTMEAVEEMYAHVPLQFRHRNIEKGVESFLGRQ